MQVFNLARSVTVRFALAFAGAAALVMGVLLVVIYWSMIGILERQLNTAVDQQFQVLQDDLAQDGRDALLALVRQQLEPRGGATFHILILDGGGNRIAGDLPRIAPVEGWQDISVPSLPGDDDDVRPLRARGAWAAESTFVLVAHDTEDLVESRELILRSFAWALGVTVVLALGGGLFIAVTLLGRVDAASGSARAIMNGDLSRRIPVSARGDELDRLADAFNGMLERIEELMENLRHVTSDVAHDLRTPLGRLRQRLEASRVKPRAAAEYEATIDTAIEDTDTIIKTFDAMLRIAQIESGARRERFARVDLAALVENVCEVYAAVAEDSGRSLVARVDPDVTIQGDRELLTQLLANLIENALRHTPERTLVEVHLRGGRGGARLSVSDNGAGIPAKERERVLRRFYRLDRSRSTPGSGLGLSLVAAVAKLHEARVVLEDNEPGLRVHIDFAGNGHG